MQEFKPFKAGKVREIYDNGDNLIMVATDRISAFDVVLPKGIPFKGQVLKSNCSTISRFNNRHLS